MKQFKFMRVASFFGAMALLFTINNLFAQADKNTLSVYGVSEVVVEPDEIYLSIALTEYMDNGVKVPLSQLENKLLTSAKSMGITHIAVENLSGYGSYGYEGEQGFLASKIYQIKTKDFQTAEQLMNKLQTAGMTSLSVSYYANSKSKTHLRALKTQAIKNAQEEAEALAKAVGKKVGALISIQEVQDPSTYNLYPMDVYSNPPSSTTTGSGNLVPRSINYKYAVLAVFELL